MRAPFVALVLGAALLAAPTPAATSAPTVDADRATQVQQTARQVSARDRVIAIVNNKRQAHGCRPLGKNAALMRAAQTHTVKMAGAGGGGTLSHQLPGEAGLGARITNAGYTGWTLVGENIAHHYTTPAQVMNGWMNSTYHRRNILNCRFKHIGVGFARSSNGTPYWTQDFGRR